MRMAPECRNPRPQGTPQEKRGSGQPQGLWRYEVSPEGSTGGGRLGVGVVVGGTSKQGEEGTVPGKCLFSLH